MTRLTLLFARRYLFSAKSHSIINLISGISAFTVAIPVAAMVVLLSVFNGFDGMIKQMYKNFDPDIQITAQRGKTFDRNGFEQLNINKIEGVDKVSYFLEENALFSYRNRQYIGMMRGVDSVYQKVVPIDSMITAGEFVIKHGDLNQAVIGQGLSYALGIGLQLIDPLYVYIPNKGSGSSILPIDNYRSRRIFPVGVFALDAETDSKYMLVPYDFAEDILDAYGRASAVMVKLTPGANEKYVKAEIERVIGSDYKVLTRFQQKETFYRIMQYEKWGIYLIILLVLIIASFSIVGSLIMLIIDKRDDTFTLATMGANNKLISNIFIAEGMLISGIGAISGVGLGLAICLLQQQFGFVELKGDTFLLDTYPVVIKLSDLFWITLTVGLINYLMSRFTVMFMMRRS